MFDEIRHWVSKLSMLRDGNAGYVRRQNHKGPAPVNQAGGVSVICPCNNMAKLEKYLLPSLEKQSVPHELLLIDNTEGVYPSAAPILNQTAQKARYGHLMFVHQDVSLDSENWLADALAELASLQKYCVAGVAGINRWQWYASVYSDSPRRFIGKKKLSKPVRVQTLDGCLLLVSRELFTQHPFDESATDGWYLFVANYCLDLARIGYHSYVLPQCVFHESPGPEDRSVFEGMRAIMADRHKDHVKTIYTTVGKWSTRR